MHYKEIMDILHELAKIGTPAGVSVVALRMMKYTYSFMLRKRPIESSKKFDKNGNLVEVTEKFRD